MQLLFVIEKQNVTRVSFEILRNRVLGIEILRFGSNIESYYQILGLQEILLIFLQMMLIFKKPDAQPCKVP